MAHYDHYDEGVYFARKDESGKHCVSVWLKGVLCDSHFGLPNLPTAQDIAEYQNEGTHIDSYANPDMKYMKEDKPSMLKSSYFIMQETVLDEHGHSTNDTIYKLCRGKRDCHDILEEATNIDFVTEKMRRLRMEENYDFTKDACLVMHNRIQLLINSLSNATGCLSDHEHGTMKRNNYRLVQDCQELLVGLKKGVLPKD